MFFELCLLMCSDEWEKEFGECTSHILAGKESVFSHAQCSNLMSEEEESEIAERQHFP